MKDLLQFVGHLLTIVFSIVGIGMVFHLIYYILKFGWNLV